MSNGAEDITSLECSFFDDSKVEKINEQFPKICEVNPGSTKCFTAPQDDIVICNIVDDKLNKLNRKLNEMLQSYQGESNVFFSNGTIGDVKKQCICLKQWCYNKIIKDLKEQTDVYNIFKTCNTEIKDKINDVPTNICKFRNLNIKQMERMKMIFDFYLFYFRNIKDSTVDQKLNKYTKYFRKGFYELCNSIIECLNNESNSEYCNEFKEYHKKYNAFEVFLESLISYKDEVDGSEYSEECILSEKLLNGHYLLQLRDEIERIMSRYRPSNFQTTAITVVFLVIGTITPNELWLRTLKLINKEAHANIDDETESNSLFTSENQENTFKNKGYTISYKSANYS
ncbi:PIR protein [Plasmodium ovale]|uniref:PIR protein n=1 Tax=Plasmodium ovale TaxID=36330 RepID=A0A1C3KEL9_PLAOA|nr:PIR protein [Plasmodium ovale]